MTTTTTVLFIAMASVFAMFLGLTIAVLGRHYVYYRRNIWFRDREATLRPLIYETLFDTDPDPAQLERMSKRDRAVAEKIIWQMLPKFTDEPHAHIHRLLQETNSLDRVIASTRSMRAATRGRALFRLGYLDQQQAIPIIAKLLRDRDEDVRTAAVHAAGQSEDPSIADEIIACLTAKRTVPYNAALAALIHMGNAAHETLLENIAHPSTQVRSVCVETLGYLSTEKNLAALSFIAQHDAAPSVRTKAILALGQSAEDVSIELLVRAVRSDEHPIVRQAAVGTLPKTHNPHIAGALQLALFDEDRRVSLAAAKALSQLGGTGVEILHLAAASDMPARIRAREWLDRLAVAESAIPESGASS